MSSNPTITDKIQQLRACISSYPNFPKDGVIFRDIFGIFHNPAALATLREVLIDYTKNNFTEHIDCICGLEARGFLLGPMLALELEVPFVPIRKKGKLPGNVLQQTYSLEYGEDILEVQETALESQNGLRKNVLVVDDLLATGGTLAASCSLIEQAGASVLGALVLLELVELKGRQKIHAPVVSVITY